MPGAGSKVADSQLPSMVGGGSIVPMSRWIAKTILWVIAAFYAYGALVHVLNIFGLTGFQWVDAPLKWQILDVVYLVVDVVVVIGLLAGSRIGYSALFVAAISQIVLYTMLRDWIINVPGKFARSLEETAYLDGLFAFHIMTLSLVCLAIWLNQNAAQPTSGRVKRDGWHQPHIWSVAGVQTDKVRCKADSWP